MISLFIRPGKVNGGVSPRQRGRTTKSQVQSEDAAQTASAQLSSSNTNLGYQHFKAGPWFDVMAYGADPTGAADSTTAVQAAITAAGAAGGGTVYIPIGTYKVSATLNISSPWVSVVGQNQTMWLSIGSSYGTAFKLTSSFSGTKLFNVTANQVSLSGFSVYSAAASGACTISGVYAAGLNGLTLRNIYLENIGGIIFSNVNRSVVEDVVVQNCNSTYGFSATNCTIVYFNRCNAAANTASTACWYFNGCETIVHSNCEGNAGNGNPGYSLYLTGTKDSTFADFEANGGTIRQIYINSCTDVRFDSVFVEQPCTIQVYINVSNIIQFIGGWITNGSNYGIVIDGSASACHDIIFSGLFIQTTSTTLPPINVIGNAYNLVVTGNEISASAASTAPWISDASSSTSRVCTYSSNIIWNCAAATIATVSGSGAVAMAGNAGIAIPAVTPTFANGTAAQLSDTTRDYMVYLQFGAAGTGLTLAIGPTSSPANTIINSAAVSGGEVVNFRLPAGWYARISFTTTTLANQKAIGL